MLLVIIRNLGYRGLVGFAILIAGALPRAQTVGESELSVSSLADDQITLSWPAAALGFVLEQTEALTPTTVWQPVSMPPAALGDELSVTMSRGTVSRFYRLRQELTRVRGTSPVNGETGVAVIRETIVHFSAPLSPDAVVRTDNLYAGFGGRRLLSRVELSADRRQATLFYLEPLPGSSRVLAVFDGVGLMDHAGQPLDPDGDGLPGGQVVIAFDTLSLTALPGTAVVGRVFASELAPGPDTGTNAVNRPLEGVTITVDGREQDLRTTTDALGNFTLSPVPPGRFFVKIDGRTAKGSAYPDGAYYPYVGKAWEAVAGRIDNLAGGTGEIFLPLITAGTLQAVSLTSDTTISFPPSVVAGNPALAGVSITVPANSLFSDDGTRGGKVGIAPVPPDRLPGPLPPGLELPIVITVQTDGPLNFDKPAPICFPNLPNPTLGKPWPPGTKGSLISFNHKKGTWEAVGDMTVSADGKFFCTDPGVGILQPGWHGPQCPPPKGPPPPPTPDPPPCKPDAAALLKCLESSKAAGDECRRIADIIESSIVNICNEYRVSRGNAFASKCLRQAGKDWKARRDACTVQEVHRNKECNQCNGTPLPQSSKNQAAHLIKMNLAAADGSKAIYDQIVQDLNSINELLAPYLDSDTDLPQMILAQIDALLAHANAIAGGDSVQFLKNAAIELERANAALLENNLVPNRGNAPAYPVLYAAEIQRAEETIMFRGQTEPFGQYLVFVPPDGDLVSVRFFDQRTKQYGGISPNIRPEAPYGLPRFNLNSLPANAADSDQDGLPDVVESVYGTDLLNPDTDGDGIPDGAEIEAGTDPLGGLIVQTGVIATVKTPGPALDVYAGNEIVATAEGAAGVSIFNAYRGINPTLIAHLDTPGNALRVAGSGPFIAVADGAAGLAIIDITDPATARIVHQRRFIGAAVAVAVAGGTAYVGLDSGALMAVDLASGRPLRQLFGLDAVRDVAASGDYVYVLTETQIHVIFIAAGGFSLASSTASPAPALSNRRLYVGGGLAYAVHGTGYNTFTLTDPGQARLIRAGTTAQYGWRQMTVTGSGLALAAVGPNSSEDGPHDVSLYDVSDPTQGVTVITTFPTPGRAQSVALWKGLAYVADGDAGLQVISYVAYDSKGTAPKVSLSASFPLAPAQIQEDASFWIAANATDDVQVREVEFYLDGNRVETDGGFPFEFRLEAPRIAAGKDSFKVRARAIDTGGNFAWSEEITVAVLPDTRPLRVTQVSPRTAAAKINSVAVTFDHEIVPGSLTPAALKLFTAGPDGVLGTVDDAEWLNGTRSLQDGQMVATLGFGADLPPGNYRIVAGREFTDRRGKHLDTDFSSDFRVVVAVHWVNPDGGDWSEPQNWSTGRLPGPDDDVLIATPDPVAITHSRGNDSIKSLLSDNPVLLNGGRLEIAGALQVNDLLHISGVAILARARLLPGTGSTASFAILRATFDGVTLDCDLTLASQAVTVINGLTVNGVLTLAGTGVETRMSFDGMASPGDQTLGGTGQVLFAGTGPAVALNVRFTTLTIGAGLTVHGGGGILGGREAPLINLGTIVADVAGGILVVAGGPFTNQGLLETRPGAVLALDGSWTNTGTIRVTQGELELRGVGTTAGLGKLERTGGVVKVVGTLDNTAATLALDDKSGSFVLAGGTIRGGHFTTSGGAKLEIPLTATLDGVTLDSDLTLTNPLVTIIHGLTVNGVLTLAGTGAGTRVLFDGQASPGDQTVGGTGEVVFGGSGPSVGLGVRSTTLTIGAGLTIHGASGTVGDRGAPLINLGTIVADAAGGTISIQGKPFTNNGTITELNGGKVVVVP